MNAGKSNGKDKAKAKGGLFCFGGQTERTGVPCAATNGTNGPTRSSLCLTLRVRM